jgi:hypothetical protein
MCDDRGGARPGRRKETVMKKAIGWVLVALVVFYIGTQPGPAADIAKGMGDVIGQIFRNVGTFFRQLFT